MSYSWIPAGINYRRDGGTGVYVKHGLTGVKRTIIKESTRTHVWVVCPDRELVLVTHQHTDGEFRPMSCNFDEYVHLGIFDDDIAVDFDLPYYMTNYTADINKESTSAHNRREAHTYKTKVMSDSGGFQLGQGRLEFIDPIKLQEWYNTNSDMGMVLDIPVFSEVSDEMLLRMAKVQAANTEKMMSIKAPHVELINISHGMGDRQKLEYEKIVRRDDITKLAIGGVYNGSILSGVRFLYNEFARNNEHYNHYHILGVANPLQVLLLQRMAKHNMAPTITSDSSTFLRNAITKTYHIWNTIATAPQFVHMGNSGGFQPSATMELPCSCPVCRTVKYSDVLFGVPHNATTQLIMMHNIYGMKRYFDSMYPLIERMETKELQSFIKSHFRSGRVGVEEAIHGIGYIDTIVEEGIKVADNKYRMFLNSLSSTTTNSAGFLLDSEAGLSFDSYEGEEENDEVSESSVGDVLLRYEKYHAGDKESASHGKKLESLVTRKGSNVAKDGARPGDKNKKKKSKVELEKERLELEAKQNSKVKKVKNENLINAKGDTKGSNK